MARLVERPADEIPHREVDSAACDLVARDRPHCSLTTSVASGLTLTRPRQTLSSIVFLDPECTESCVENRLAVAVCPRDFGDGSDQVEDLGKSEVNLDLA